MAVLLNAPLIVMLVSRPWGAVAIAIATIGLAFLDRKGMFGTHGEKAFIASALVYFLIGIASRFAVPTLQKYAFNPAPVAAIAVSIILVVARPELGIATWVAVFPFLCASRSRAFSALLCNPFMLFLGRISYSLYLVHFVVLTMVGYAMVQIFPEASKPVMLMALFGGVLAAIPVSAGLYQWVEKPGIAIGRSLSGRLGGAWFWLRPTGLRFFMGDGGWRVAETEVNLHFPYDGRRLPVSRVLI